MSEPTCANCGNPKPEDRFRACPDRRAAWREEGRSKRASHGVPGRPVAVAVDRSVLVALEGAATARGLAAKDLARKILEQVAADGLTDAVLDDQQGERAA